MSENGVVCPQLSPAFQQCSKSAVRQLLTACCCKNTWSHHSAWIFEARPRHYHAVVPVLRGHRWEKSVQASATGTAALGVLQTSRARGIWGPWGRPVCTINHLRDCPHISSLVEVWSPKRHLSGHTVQVHCFPMVGKGRQCLQLRTTEFKGT